MYHYQYETFTCSYVHAHVSHKCIDHRDGVKKTQHNAKASESVTYENFFLQDAKLSAAQQQVKPMAENNVNVHYNPVYLAVGNPQVKP